MSEKTLKAANRAIFHLQLNTDEAIRFVIKNASVSPRTGGGGGGGAQVSSTYIVGGGGGGGGGRGATGGNGGAGNPGAAATPTTFNCVSVTPGGSYPVVVPTGGQVVISWNAQ
jgi:hypothetical protein